MKKVAEQTAIEWDPIKGSRTAGGQIDFKMKL